MTTQNTENDPAGDPPREKTVAELAAEAGVNPPPDPPPSAEPLPPSDPTPAPAPRPAVVQRPGSQANSPVGADVEPEGHVAGNDNAGATAQHTHSPNQSGEPEGPGVAAQQTGTAGECAGCAQLSAALATVTDERDQILLYNAELAERTEAAADDNGLVAWPDTGELVTADQLLDRMQARFKEKDDHVAALRRQLESVGVDPVPVSATPVETNNTEGWSLGRMLKSIIWDDGAK